ncbi:MAG: glycosyltransferase family 4 protein [Solirubrobacteraceae bacterium]
MEASADGRANGDARSERNGLVMLCDVDLEALDATRTHTIEVARCFADAGLEVDLIARGPDPQIAGVRYHSAHGTEAQKVRRILTVNLHTIGVLYKRRRTAWRLYVRHHWSNTPVLLAGRVLGYRVVTQVDDVPYGRSFEPDIAVAVDYVKRLTTVIMGRIACGIVAVTSQIKGLLVEEFHVPPERVAVLPNGVDVDFFRPSPRAQAIERLGLEPGCRYAVFLGRFQPWVDFDTLLEGFAIVAARRSDARLILVGDGFERERVERDTLRLGIADSVLITGFIRERTRIRDYMCAGTVALAAHRREYVGHIGVSPTKLAEYLAMGRAVIAEDVPGLREVLEESGAGVVVPADPKAMAEAIESLLDPVRADELGVLGRRLAEERYSWRSVVERTLPLFQDGAQAAGRTAPAASHSSM